MIKDDWTVFIRDIDKPLTDEERAEAIADVLRAGTPSQLFCLYLAEMIRPLSNNKLNASSWRFKLCRKENGRPKDTFRQVDFEMEHLVDVEGLSVDAAVAEVQRQHGIKGNSKRSCEAGLKRAQEWSRMARMLDEWESKPPQKTK
ncbi:hypothetical protein [Hyphomicrobium sp.]|jgi:hypothetical protein|uniref:hypothetical protein n=1 Tax=Hyphomicrobium sp. TaxID=82 RepID=UPI002C103D78|nr:hypothetical protein [Hyphomicrobium sp.]HVZ06234.1 hypothetical protein [Hyphomicrobium sp.]